MKCIYTGKFISLYFECDKKVKWKDKRKGIYYCDEHMFMHKEINND